MSKINGNAVNTLAYLTGHNVATKAVFNGNIDINEISENSKISVDDLMQLFANCNKHHQMESSKIIEITENAKVSNETKDMALIHSLKPLEYMAYQTSKKELIEETLESENIINNSTEQMAKAM